MDTPSIFGQHDEATLEQLNQVGERARFTALMADGHRGFVMPIGGVAAYRNQVSVVGVGFDIGCGNCAIKTSLQVDLEEHPPLHPYWVKIADEIANTISFGIGRIKPVAMMHRPIILVRVGPIGMPSRSG